MVAIIKGYNPHTKENFQYTKENIISVQYHKGQCLITYIDENGKLQVSSYSNDEYNINVIFYN